MAPADVRLKPFLISFALVVGLELLNPFLQRTVPIPPLLTLGVLRGFECFLILAVFRLWGDGLSDLGLAAGQWWPGLKKGLIWSAGFGGVAGLGFLVLFGLDKNPLVMVKGRMPQACMELVLYFIVGGIVGPFVEEVVFRGVLYGFFRKWGLLPALAISTLAFAGAHPGGSVVQVTGGVVFCLAYEVEQKLLAPITIHILGNLALFTISLIASTGAG